MREAMHIYLYLHLSLDVDIGHMLSQCSYLLHYRSCYSVTHTPRVAKCLSYTNAAATHTYLSIYLLSNKWYVLVRCERDISSHTYTGLST